MNICAFVGVLIKQLITICLDITQRVGRDSVLDITNRYGLDGPGIESRCERVFHTRPERPQVPTSLLHNGYRILYGGKSARAWS